MSLPVALVRRLVVSVLLVGLVAAWLGRPGPERMRITAEFARAGLNVRPGDEVRVRGVPVGTIASIEVDREAFTARYTLSVDADAPIAADTTAALVPKTLFGDKYVELQSASTAGELLRDGAHIPLARTSAPTEVQEVLDRLQPVLAEVDPVTFANVIASTAEGLDGAPPSSTPSLTLWPRSAPTRRTSAASSAPSLASPAHSRNGPASSCRWQSPSARWPPPSTATRMSWPAS
jgi:phospholipid/cholesterol/gamma-HCH transport system substrate-binding protein